MDIYLISVVDHVEMYDRLEWAYNGVWHDTYSRPPQMIGNYDHQEVLPSFWRK